MKVFIAGASGAVGIPIVKELSKQGHEVAAMTRSERGIQQLQTLGAKVMSIDAFDYKQIKDALQQVAPEAVIDMLTFLPKNLADMPKAFPGDRKLRLEGGGHLFAASVASGVSRYLQQSCGFWIKPKSGEYLGTEDDPFELQATPNIASGSDMYRQVEERVFSDPKIDGIALRFGFFYGPGTWYTEDGSAAEMARQQHLPIVGKGSAVNSFVHVDDAAKATVSTLTVEPGVYDIVDDDPVAVSTWLPAFAASVGAPPPPQISEEAGVAAAGPDAAFYHNNLSGASNAKAKKIFGFEPRPLEWLKR
ncbi:NAD-dependent epimerase/dehydratase family protein [Edaphobacter bradus]|uniref:NAD-dependent epimerase/dehydratase family protein n=1 Tax=Edaphobacter bradus TaxID=2259016 RepID=UPI0021E0BAEF|nr:NAD(P)-dependent oxidoreductase [Edaphobacter bradus]